MPRGPQKGPGTYRVHIFGPKVPIRDYVKAKVLLMI